MRDFSYARAADMNAALKAGADGAMILAGGTELFNWMRLGIVEPSRVLDIGRLADLKYLARAQGRIEIGAAGLEDRPSHPLWGRNRRRCPRRKTPIPSPRQVRGSTWLSLAIPMRAVELPPVEICRRNGSSGRGR